MNIPKVFDMDIYTAHYTSTDPDRLDITIQGEDPLGKYFAPTWKIIMDYKSRNYGHASADVYTHEYHELMLKSYYDHQDKWQELLSRKRVVLVCFCRSGEFCHRLLLALYLQKLGAIYRGEL